MRERLLLREGGQTRRRRGDAAQRHRRGGFVRVLAVARQAYPDGRDRLDDPANSLAAQQRRDRQGVREAQERYQAGDTAAESYLRRYDAALISRPRSDSSTSSLERARRGG